MAKKLCFINFIFLKIRFMNLFINYSIKLKLDLLLKSKKLGFSVVS